MFQSMQSKLAQAVQAAPITIALSLVGCGERSGNNQVEESATSLVASAEPEKSAAVSTEQNRDASERLQIALDKCGHPFAEKPALTLYEWIDYVDQVYKTAGFDEIYDSSRTSVRKQGFRDALEARFEIQKVNGLTAPWTMERTAELPEIVTADKLALEQFTTEVRSYLAKNYKDHELDASDAAEVINEFAKREAGKFLPPELKGASIMFLAFDVSDLIGDAIKLKPLPETHVADPNELLQKVKLPPR